MPISKEKRALYQNIISIPVTVGDQGIEKDVTAFQDNYGIILTKKEVMKARDEFLADIEKSGEFYAMEGVEEAIRKENIKTYLSSFSFGIKFKKNNNGDLIIPAADLKQKKFKPNLKREWSFTCDWCGQKTSSKTDHHYYGINFPYLPRLFHSHERACSKECGQHIWNKVIRNWVYKN